MKPSRKFRLGIWDFLKGLVMSALGAGLTVVHTSLEAGNINVDAKETLTTAAIAGSAYVLKNLFEDKEREAREIVANSDLNKE